MKITLSQINLFPLKFKLPSFSLNPFPSEVKNLEEIYFGIKLKFLLIFLFVILVLPFCSSTHYITGIVNDAFDRRDANDLEVILWNPLNGINDNLTDVIGVNGNSGASNIYLIDCEMLKIPCEVNDVLNVKVLSYPYSFEVNLTVTGAGFDVVSNITLNSLPTTSLVFPENFANTSLEEINFNCSYEDLDSNIENVGLYGNWSGGFHLNETKSVSGESGSVLFSKNLEEGIYEWSCFAGDNLSVFTFAENNFTLNVDRTEPIVNSVLVNESFVCGTSSFVRVICNTNDFLTGIKRVFIEARKPNGTMINYSASFLSGDDYYADIFLNLEGEWDFNCISIDFSNNSANLSSSEFIVYSDLPDLEIFPEINFSNANPVESENVTISTFVFNNGCSDADNFLVGFFDGDPFLGNQIGNNETISVLGRSNKSVNVSWSAKVGPTNIFSFADLSYVISEFNETNNEDNKTIDVGLWQEFYGNVSSVKILSDKNLNNFTLWEEGFNQSGNVFMTDMESNIDWTSLVAISRNSSGGISYNDFSEIDSGLGTSDFKDSVEEIFTTSGVPDLTKDFFVHKNDINDVPIINSTETGVFFTGILWDSSDDTNGEYDLIDKEDLVFVAELNRRALGSYGVYDYELRVPVNLRSYDSTNEEDIYFYYDLV